MNSYLLFFKFVVAVASLSLEETSVELVTDAKSGGFYLLRELHHQLCASASFTPTNGILLRS